VNEGFKGRSYRKNTLSELKAVLEMTTTTRPDTSYKTTTPLTHSCNNDGVTQLVPYSSDAMFEVVEISDACFVHLLLCSTCCSQPDSYLVKLHDTVAAN